MKKVLTCILNDKAGSSCAAEAGTLVARMATEQGWEARIAICAGGAELNSHAEQARAVGGLVVGGGGDGTIAATAAALVDMDAVLGVLPMETLNHFAKDLSIPRKLEEAVQTLFSGRIARVDVGEVNGRVFPNISSIGFYPRIVQEREREQQRGRNKCRVDGDVAVPIPHRPGRAEFPHPVLHERDSLAAAYPWAILAGGRGWRFRISLKRVQLTTL